MLVGSLDPDRAALGGHSDAVHEQVIDREDPLLSLGRRRRHPPELVHERMVQLAQIGIEGRERGGRSTSGSSITH
jgi:hypothetical protein